MKIQFQSACSAAQALWSRARVADIGTDHGYLGIYLLKNGIARQVTACDLRPLPLRNAQENAERFGVGAQMEFLLSDGLERVTPDRIDTVVCAGMGGDLIVRILEACAWIRDPGYRLVLQPQSAGQALRLWLAENGYEMQRETLVQDGSFLYTVLTAWWDGEKRTLSPGEQFVSPQLRAENSPLLDAHIQRVENALPRDGRGPSRRGASAAGTPCLSRSGAARDRRNEGA